MNTEQNATWIATTQPARPARLLRIASVSDRVGMSRSAIYRAIKAGAFPAPVPLNDKSVAWVESEVEAWIAKRIAARDGQPE